MANSKPRKRRTDFQDLTGRIFEPFEVLGFVGPDNAKDRRWHCRCTKCGHEKYVHYKSLVRDNTVGLCQGCFTQADKNRLVPQPAECECIQCHTVKPFTREFFMPGKANLYGLRHDCRECNKAGKRISGPQYHRALRIEVMSHYSGGTPHCACCQESIIEFLSLDHIDGGGKAHRKSFGGSRFLRGLKNHGYPPGLRVLCHNCNQCLGCYGKCYHKEQFDTLTLPPVRASHKKPRDIDIALDLITTETQTCFRCQRTLLLNANYFYQHPQMGNGFLGKCRDCARADVKEPTLQNRRRLRIQVLRHYGGEEPKCACCGVFGIPFLNIDHIHGGGRQDRITNGDVYKRLRREGFPEGFRVLCCNCNQALGLYGYCPHKEN